jgi:allophanate hydrolase
MNGALIVRSIGPAVAIQDLGRPGFMSAGLTHGGASDPIALYEGAALLGHDPNCAALEMAGMGGSFEASEQTQIALTGAVMDASIDGVAIQWNASHSLPTGSVLNIGAARRGNFGYLHVSNGFDTPRYLGTRGSHISAGLGRLAQAGDHLPIGKGNAGQIGMFLAPEERLEGGKIRFMRSMQSDKFDDEIIDRFTHTQFQRDPRGNRQGIRMDFKGDGFQSAGQLNVVSEVIVAGDIQITGDGTPFVLMHECQTTGGYPRIGTILPVDLSKVSQAPVGKTFRFELVSFDEAAKVQAAANAALLALPKAIKPLLRDVSKMQDLLSYQLISGAVSANESPLDEG